MPSARSSATAPVGIASTGSLLSAPSRISEPAPKSRSIWVTAASSASSFALASFADTSFKGVFLSGISSFTSLPPVSGQLDLRQRGVSRTLRLEYRTVERHPDAMSGFQEPLWQCSGELPDHGRTPRPAARGLDPGDRHVRPEPALLRPVEVLRDE